MARSRLSCVILTLALLLSSQLAEAQARFEVSTGAGLFDGIFLKAKYGQIVQVGLSQPGRASRFGLNADLGVAIHRSTNPPEGYITELFPISASLGFFYRF
jgi:hypothetical protein